MKTDQKRRLEQHNIQKYMENYEMEKEQTIGTTHQECR